MVVSIIKKAFQKFIDMIIINYLLGCCNEKNKCSFDLGSDLFHLSDSMFF